MLPSKVVRCYAHDMARVMGIDYGSRRVGVALSDDAQVVAFPNGILPNNDTLIATLTQRVADEGVQVVVVGEADNPAGGTNAIQRRVMLFAEALRIAINCEVLLVPEAYSSAEARRALMEHASERSTRQLPVDAAAAAIILQMYLDGKRRT